MGPNDLLSSTIIKEKKPRREIPDALNALIVEKITKEEFGEGFDDFQEADQFDDLPDNNANDDQNGDQNGNNALNTVNPVTNSNINSIGINGNPTALSMDDDDFGDFDAFP